MNWIFRAALLLLLSVNMTSLSFANDFTLLAVNYAPLSYKENGKLSGVAIETVQAIQKRSKNNSPILLLPWQRAYARSLDEVKIAIFPIVRIPEREKKYKWVGPIFSEGDYFFKRKGNPLAITSLEDAKSVNRIAVRKATYPHIMLEAKGFTNLDVGPTYKASYKKLVSGRVDLVLLGERTYRYMVKGQGLDPDLFVPTDYLIETSSAWIAFSLDTPDEVIQRWQDSLDALKAEQEHQQIMDRNFKP